MAARFKQALAIPVVAVGGLRSLQVINTAIAKGQCDAVAMSRPLIRQPDLPRRLAEGHSSECIGCCRCLLVNDRPTACHATAEEPA